jgi:hypothetical protein
LIINYLSLETHETTGKKPAIPEINNKLNVTIKPQYPYNLHPENQINQMNQLFRQTPDWKMHSNGKSE